MKKISIAASIAACALAMSTMALSASAAVTNGNATGADGSLFYQMDVLTDYDVTAIYGVKVDLTYTEAGSGCGGGFGFNSDSTGWKSIEYGNTDSGKALILDENGDFTYTSDSAIFASTDTFAQIWVQNWWGAEVTVESITPLDASGAELAKKGATTTAAADTATTTTAAATTAAAGATTAATTKSASTTTAATTASTNTGDAGVAVALAGLTLAGAVAFVAKRK